MNKLREAKKILVNYFRVAIEPRGYSLQGDEISEIEAVVDMIFEAAVEEAMRRIAANDTTVSRVLPNV